MSESICDVPGQKVCLDPQQLWCFAGCSTVSFFFNMFMDPLRCEEVTILKYADDIAICCPEKSAEDTRVMFDVVTEIQSWSNTRGLLLNSDKCKQIVFRLRTSSTVHPTQIPYDTVASIKYLGITFSADTTWALPMEPLFDSARKMCYFIRRLRQFNLPQSYSFKFVQACILSVVLQCSPVLFPGLLVKDFVILRRLLRLIACVGALPYEQLVELLVKRHVDDCRLLAERILSNINHPLHMALPPAISKRNTRQQYRLLPARTSRYRTSAIPYLARLLNDPTKVRDDLANHLL